LANLIDDAPVFCLLPSRLSRRRQNGRGQRAWLTLSPLFDIDPRPYRAQLVQYEGQLARDKAILGKARITWIVIALCSARE
jgi:hypothetical protein